MQRRTKAHHEGGWTREQFDYLRGLDSWEWSDDGPFASEAEMREAWCDLGQLIEDQHVARRPGTRSAAWWCADAPEGCRIIAYEIFSKTNHTPSGCFIGWRDPPSPVLEPEVVYLDRLGFLGDGELDAYWRTGSDHEYELLPLALRPPTPPSWYPARIDGDRLHTTTATDVEPDGSGDNENP